MRRILLIISLCCTLTIGAQKNKNPKPFIVPELKEWIGKDGFLMLSEKSTIVYPKGDTMLKKIPYCQEFYNAMKGEPNGN